VSVDDLPAFSAIWLARPLPNPSRGASVVRFGLPQAIDVSVGIYDVQGRQVAALVNGTLAEGEHTARWDGSDAAGGAAPSGLYFVTLRSGAKTLSERLAIVR
jgi:flagellar hook assembly protein FlgD